MTRHAAGGAAGPRARQPGSARLLNERAGANAFERSMGLAAHRPQHVCVQFASGCNLDCYMCSEHNRPREHRHGKGLQSLPPELFEKLEREVFPWSRRLTIGMGGEPMLSEHFQDYLGRAYDAGQEITVLTNGTRIDQPGMAQAIARCVALFQVSLDAATAETYERIRIGARWKAMRARIDLLNEQRGAYSREGRTWLSLQFVLMRSNVHELPAFIELAGEVEADVVELQHVIPVTEEGRGESLIDEPERFNQLRAEALGRARELGIEVIAPGPYSTVVEPQPAAAESGDGTPATAAEPTSEPVSCSMPTMQVFVIYDGRVFPCCHPYAQQKMQVGDLRTQSFAEIWNGVLYRNLRAGLARGEVHDICRACSIAHDPPPVAEDPAALSRAPELWELFEGRDLDPVGGRATELLPQLTELGLLDYFTHLEEAAERSARCGPGTRFARALRRVLGRGGEQ